MIKRSFFILFGVILSCALWAQDGKEQDKNSAETMLSGGNKMRIGGYGQIDYNHPFEEGILRNGKIDVHRLVLLFNYKFSNKTQFLTEIEFEHVKEVYIEQAFLQHRFNKFLNLRAGLILIPMGIINEYHEPTAFNGVERPNLDKIIIPSTWREIGFGITGRLESASLKYQAYLVNGFKSYDDRGLLTSSSGLRSGRQKGAKSIIRFPNFSSKIDFYGFPRLRLGLAAYVGKTQSTAFDGIDKGNELLIQKADSTVIGVNMFALDAKYNVKGLSLRGQYVIAALNDVDAYNAFTGTDLGNLIGGYYLELAYDLFHHAEKFSHGLIPFLRYEHYNTHQRVSGFVQDNPANNRTDITLGIGWKLTDGAMIKTDYQWFFTKNGHVSSQFNCGVGVWFK